MDTNKIKWIGEIAGKLHIFDRTEKVLVLKNCEDIISYLCNSEYDADFLSKKELSTLGAISLFMAIRDIAPYKKGNVLESAFIEVGGRNSTMIGHHILHLHPMEFHTFFEFRKGAESLVNKLRKVQTESQHTIKCAAFHYIKEVWSS